jgi:hypothetical protein
MTIEKKATHAFKIWSEGASEVERKIAKKHGQRGPKDTFWGDVGRDIGSSLKAHAEGAVTGIAAGALGFKGAKALAQRALNHGATNITRAHKFAIGTGLGSYLIGHEAGKLHSYHRQGKAMEKKYQEKAAHAVNMLIDQGVDFETAADLVMEKVALWGTIGGAVAGGKDHRWGGAGIGLVGDVINGQMLQHRVHPGVAALASVAGIYGAHKYGQKTRAKDEAEEIAKAKRIHDAIHQEKQAAVNSLVDKGIDFDTAVDLVDSKAQELYGD